MWYVFDGFFSKGNFGEGLLLKLGEIKVLVLLVKF